MVDRGINTLSQKKLLGENPICVNMNFPSHFHFRIDFRWNTCFQETIKFLVKDKCKHTIHDRFPLSPKTNLFDRLVARSSHQIIRVQRPNGQAEAGPLIARCGAKTETHDPSPRGWGHNSRTYKQVLRSRVTLLDLAPLAGKWYRQKNEMRFMKTYERKALSREPRGPSSRLAEGLVGEGGGGRGGWVWELSWDRWHNTKKQTRDSLT